MINTVHSCKRTEEHQPQIHSGVRIAAAHAKGRGGEAVACDPAVNPCAPADKPSSIQHQFFAFHCTILYTTKKTFCRKGRILKANFQKKSGINTPMPPLRLYGRGYPITHQPHAAGPSAMRGVQASQCRDLDQRVPLQVMVPPLVRSKNKLLTPPLVRSRHGSRYTLINIQDRDRSVLKRNMRSFLCMRSADISFVTSCLRYYISYVSH